MLVKHCLYSVEMKGSNGSGTVHSFPPNADPSFEPKESLVSRKPATDLVWKEGRWAIEGQGEVRHFCLWLPIMLVSIITRFKTKRDMKPVWQNGSERSTFNCILFCNIFIKSNSNCYIPISLKEMSTSLLCLMYGCTISKSMVFPN